MEINANTEIYCIFGNPVRHSLSPLIHNTAFRELSINALYCAFEPAGIKEAIDSMKSLNILGASVTIPFKVDVLSYVDEIDDLANNIGSINTLVNNNGWIKGYNTDGNGAVSALLKRYKDLQGKTVLVLGNGGSARAIAYSAQMYGAALIIAGRNINKINSLSSDLQKNGISKSVLLNDLNKSIMQDVDIIINTTPIGMSPYADAQPIDPELLLKHHSVFDIVYSPMKTRLLESADHKGCSLIGGIEMLVNQALLQFKIWTGKDAPEDKIVQVIEKHINSIK